MMLKFAKDLTVAVEHALDGATHGATELRVLALFLFERRHQLALGHRNKEDSWPTVISGIQMQVIITYDEVPSAEFIFRTMSVAVTGVLPSHRKHRVAVVTVQQTVPRLPESKGSLTADAADIGQIRNAIREMIAQCYPLPRY